MLGHKRINELRGNYCHDVCVYGKAQHHANRGVQEYAGRVCEGYCQVKKFITWLRKQVKKEAGKRDAQRYQNNKG